MINIWYYVGTVASYILLFLPISGVLTILFPIHALHFRNRFRISFIFLLIIAIFSQFAIFGIVWGMGVKYVERTGIIKIFTDMWPMGMLILFISIFLLSLYLQSKKIGRTPYQNIYFSVAFYAALTVSGPLYFLLVEILDRFLT